MRLPFLMVAIASLALTSFALHPAGIVIFMLLLAMVVTDMTRACACVRREKAFAPILPRSVRGLRKAFSSWRKIAGDYRTS
jgi:hypothetical protein